MDRYRIAVVVSFQPPVELSRVRAFAESLVAAFNSEFLERTVVEVGVLPSTATVHMTVVSDSDEEARAGAERLIQRVAAASALTVASLEFGEVVNAGPF